MQKVPPKNQGCINPWLKINVSAGSKLNSLRSDSSLLLIGRASDFLDAGFIRPVLSDLYGTCHPVPEEKIRKRYIDTLENVYDAIKTADNSYLFDNSERMELIAEVRDGQLEILKDEAELPGWFIEYVINKS